MAVSKRLRFEVLRRDHYACRYCGRPASHLNPLEVDHVIPRSLGGTGDLDNLVAACVDCNAGKGSTAAELHPDDVVVPGGAVWREAMERAAVEELDGVLDGGLLDRVVGAVDESWCTWQVKDTGEPVPRPSDWRRTVRTWVSRGMPMAELIEGIGIAMKNPRVPPADTWRYYCGVTWKTLTRLEQRARDTLAAESDARCADLRENAESI